MQRWPQSGPSGAERMPLSKELRHHAQRAMGFRSRCANAPRNTLLDPLSLQLAHGEFRLGERNTHYGSKPKGFKVPKDSEVVAAIMQRHGVEWPADLRSDCGSDL